MRLTRRKFFKVLGISVASIPLGISLFNKKGEALSLSQAPIKGDAEQYSMVRFHSKQHVTDPDEITMSLNGNTLVVKRGVPVIIPNSYIEVVNHANYYTTEGSPFGPLKAIKHAKFPYTFISPSSRREYLAQCR